MFYYLRMRHSRSVLSVGALYYFTVIISYDSHFMNAYEYKREAETQ